MSMSSVGQGQNDNLTVVDEKPVIVQDSLTQRLNNAPDSAHGGGAYFQSPEAQATWTNRVNGCADGHAENGQNGTQPVHGVVQILEMPSHASGVLGSAPAVPIGSGAGMVPSARTWVIQYFRKWGGLAGEHPMPRPDLFQLWWSWIGAFISILLIAVVHKWLSPSIDLPLLIASFGASAVLLFGVPESKLAQPRNFLGGHILSAIVGVSFRAVITSDELTWLSGSLGMATALTVMQATQTTHPPGGATALLAATAVPPAAAHGFRFLLAILFASGLMMSVAMIVNNLSSQRRYPTFWL